MARRWSSASLFARVFLLNALVLIAAGIGLVVTPATVSSPVEASQVAVLFAGLAVLLVIDVLLLRRALGPLRRLATEMRGVDLLDPGHRVPDEGPGQELILLSQAFNEMLDRLETERRASATASLAAGDAERRRLGAELHDQVGQDLTVLLMALDRLHQRTTGDTDVHDAIADTRELTREILGSVRGIVFELRPDPLEELGLLGAVDSLCQRAARNSSVAVRARLDPDTPALAEPAELAVYRIVQEALGNVFRHAEARTVVVSLGPAPHGQGAVLSVTDDGNGQGPPAGHAGFGLRTMRERALTLEARFDVRRVPGSGTTLRLDIPRSALR